MKARRRLRGTAYADYRHYRILHILAPPAIFSSEALSRISTMANRTGNGNSNVDAGASNDSARQLQRPIILADGTWDDRLSIAFRQQVGTNTSKPFTEDCWTNVVVLSFFIPPLRKPENEGTG